MGAIRWVAVFLLLGVVSGAFASGTLVERQLVSRVLQGNLLGIEPQRRIKVYLPPGYADSNKSYPVIYYLHNFFWDNQRMFEDGRVKQVFDRAIAEGVIEPFIFVAGDYSTPFVGSFYQNNPTSGRWLDYTMDELVPFVDGNFRTLKHRDGRGFAGDFIGGYGALKLAMLRPEMFSSVYALHPVGTGLGYVPMVYRPDWEKMSRAKTYADLDGDGFSQVFLAMAQAFSPNPDKPPFYCDLIMDRQGDKFVVNPQRSEALRAGFLLDRLLPRYAANLRKMTAIKFDWARYDTNQDHVLSNQNFTRLLEEYGVEHFAEEYRGNPYDENWSEYGRVYDNMLPFFRRYLRFK